MLPLNKTLFSLKKFSKIVVLLSAVCTNSCKTSKYFANYRVTLITCKFVLFKKNVIYLFIYCVNVMASVTLT